MDIIKKITSPADTFGVQFIIRKDKLKDGKVPVYCRITVNGIITHFSLKQWHSSKSEFLIRLSGVIGDQNFVDPLFSILKKDKSMHHKAYAAKAISQIVPNERRQVEEIMNEIKSPLLDDLFKREDLKIGSSYDLTADY